MVMILINWSAWVLVVVVSLLHYCVDSFQFGRPLLKLSGDLFDSTPTIRPVMIRSAPFRPVQHFRHVVITHRYLNRLLFAENELIASPVEIDFANTESSQRWFNSYQTRQKQLETLRADEINESLKSTKNKTVSEYKALQTQQNIAPDDFVYGLIPSEDHRYKHMVEVSSHEDPGNLSPVNISPYSTISLFYYRSCAFKREIRSRQGS